MYLDLHQGADIGFLPVNHIIKMMLTLGGISLKECEHKQTSTKKAAYVSEIINSVSVFWCTSVPTMCQETNSRRQLME